MRIRRRDGNEDGAAAVEFGLLILPFAFLLFGLIQFGWYFWTAETTNSAAREVARRIVVGDCWDPGVRDAFAADHAHSFLAPVGVDPAPSTLQVGDKVTVTVTSDSEIIGFIPFIPATVSRSYEARMEVDAVSSPDRCS